MGMIERHGKLELKAIRTNGRKILIPIIEEQGRYETLLL